MTTEEAVALRQRLELDMLQMLQKYRDETGLTPVSVHVHTTDLTKLDGGERSIAITGLRITVEL